MAYEKCWEALREGLEHVYRKAWENFCSEVTSLLSWGPPAKQKGLTYELCVNLVCRFRSFGSQMY